MYCLIEYNMIKYNKSFSKGKIFMKTKTLLRSILVMLLAASMLVSMIACDKTPVETGAPETNAPETNAPSNPNTGDVTSVILLALVAVSCGAVLTLKKTR